MFDTVILLTGPSEQAALSALLLGHNPGLSIRAIGTQEALDALAPELLARARLIGFATPVLVPARILAALGYGAYNFHPGPPEYPGWMPSHFAIHDRASCFGVTAHVMSEQVDAGPIVGVERFAVPPDASVQALEELAYLHLARLLWKLAAALATQSEPLGQLAVHWSGRKTTRRMYEAMCAKERPPMKRAG
jgi:methionyl-tRNA formyltransferase